MIRIIIVQALLLSLLVVKDKNDGEKELFKEQSWKASHVAVVILSINSYLFIAYSLASYYSISYSWLSWLFVFDLLFSLILIALISITKQRIRIFGFKKFELKKNLRLVIISALILFLPFISAISGHSKAEVSIAEQIKNFGLFSGSILLLLAVIINPFIEESLYRGIVYSPYRKKYGVKIAIVINALLFSFMHGTINLTYLLCGLVYCLLYEKTESIIPGVVAHGGYNLLSIMTGLYISK